METTTSVHAVDARRPSHLLLGVSTPVLPIPALSPALTLICLCSARLHSPVSLRLRSSVLPKPEPPNEP